MSLRPRRLVWSILGAIGMGLVVVPASSATHLGFLQLAHGNVVNSPTSVTGAQFGVVNVNGNALLGSTGSPAAIGVQGVHLGNGTGPGVQGATQSQTTTLFSDPATGPAGVEGQTTAPLSNKSASGVRGISFTPNGNGVTGIAENGPQAFGVYGRSPSGWAGWFAGRALVTGMLTKGAGAFRIDHPLDPQNKYLQHSFVESPDMMNVYNGNTRTDARGVATVRLPRYFQALNRDFRYQLTPLGDLALVAVVDKIRNNRFTIKSSKPNLEISWQVTGVRKDAFANANRIKVEVAKSVSERGLYLHPELYGKSRAASVEAGKLPRR